MLFLSAVKLEWHIMKNEEVWPKSVFGHIECVFEQADQQPWSNK